MRYTSNQMQGIYQQWQQSGLSRKAFCKQHNITYQTFNYWYKRITSKTDSGFSEINLPASTVVSLEVIFPSGARITFQSEPAASWLKELVR